MKRKPKFGHNARKILQHLLEHPHSTQGELLALVRPEKITYLHPDYEAYASIEAKLGRKPTWEELPKISSSSKPSRRWGCSYFLPRNTYHSDCRASLILRGVIAVSPVKRGRCKTYVITPKGMAVLCGLV